MKSPIPFRLPTSSGSIRIESLETRIAPAVLTWTGQANNLWSVATNWMDGGSPATPQDGDTLVFDDSAVSFGALNNDTAPGNSYSLVFNANGGNFFIITGNDILLDNPGPDVRQQGTSQAQINVGLGLVNDSLFDIGGGGLIVNGVLAGGGGALAKVGPGTLVLNGPNTYGGATTINAGVLQLGNVNALGSQAGATIVSGNGAALDLKGVTIAEDITLNGTGVGGGGALFSTSAPLAGVITGTTTLGSDTMITADSSRGIRLEGRVTGPGNLTKQGPGNLFLTNNTNDYAGITTINSGAVILEANNALGATTGKTVVNAGAALNLSGITYGAAEPLELNDGELNATDRFASYLSGSFGGPITLTGTSLVPKIGSLTITGSVDGSGGLSVAFSNSYLTLVSNNSYLGPTTIFGTLIAGTTNALSPGSTITLNPSGNLDLGGFDQTVAGFTANGGILNGVATLTSATDFELRGGSLAANLAGNVGLRVTGGGTVVLHIPAFYTGATEIRDGVLLLDGDPNTLPATTNLILGDLANHDGVLDLRNSSQAISGLFTVGTGAGSRIVDSTADGIVPVLTVDLDSDSTFNGALGIPGADNFALVKGGFGTLTLTGANTYTGSTTISAGTLRIGAGGSDGTLGTGPVINNSILAFDRADLIAVNNAIGGSGVLEQNGAGATLLGNSNTYTGQTNVNAGRLILGSGTSLGSTVGGTVVASGATLDLNGVVVGDEALAIEGAGAPGATAALQNSQSSPASWGGMIALLGATTIGGNQAGGMMGLSNVISGGDYPLTKVGPNTVVLGNGSNSYGSSSVEINDGVLEVASDGALGNPGNDVVFNGGAATLRVTGTFSSARTFAVASAIGTVEVTGGNTVTLTGSIFGPGILEKIGAGNLIYGNTPLGQVPVVGGVFATEDGSAVKATDGAGVIVTIVTDGNGGTRIDTVEVVSTPAGPVDIQIKGPAFPATSVLSRIISIDPANQIGTITVGKTITLGDGIDDTVPEVDIRGIVPRLKLNDVNQHALLQLGKGLDYLDTYNNHPNIRIRDVLGNGGLEIDATGTDPNLPSGGGGLGNVIVRSWAGEGRIRTTQSIGAFVLLRGDSNIVFEVDKFGVGEGTSASVGRMTIQNGSWGSSGTEIEGTIGTFSAASFLAGATIKAANFSKFLVKNGDFAGTATFTDPDGAAVGKFSVRGDYKGVVSTESSIKNINIKGDFNGTLVAKDSIGLITAFQFDGATTGDDYGNANRFNIVALNGSLGTLYAKSGSISNLDIYAGTRAGGLKVKASAPIGISNITFDAGEIIAVSSNRAVTGSLFAARLRIGDVAIGNEQNIASVSNSLFLAGANLGGDGLLDGVGESYSKAASINSIKVTGPFTTSSIATGVDPGANLLFGDGDDVTGTGSAIKPFSIGKLLFGAGSGTPTAWDGSVNHTSAIIADTIESLKINNGPNLVAIAASPGIPFYLKTGSVEAVADIVIRRLS